MHKIQEQLLKISEKKNLSSMSLREIGKLIDCADQPQKVKHHLHQLEKKGFLTLDRQNRAAAYIKPSASLHASLVAVPIFGSANCGPAMIYAEQQAEGYLQISGRLLSRKKDIFAIKASGYSMNKANINGESIDDGDYVVIDPTYRSIKNGDYVLAVIDNNATIKRYFNDKENGRIILLAESSASYAPIFIHYQDAASFLVNGKVIQVIKKPKTTWSKIKRLINSD
jgi:SOS-response transcriptional repressor LexA